MVPQDLDNFQVNNSNIVHQFENKVDTKFMTKRILMIFIFIALSGFLTGYILATPVLQKGKKSQTTNYTKEDVKKGQIFGSSDLKTFTDQVEGVLKEGGIDGEGEYHLERPGGISQNVYLTSSVVDLSAFIERKVRIWGQTNKAKKAGWLMDIGKLEVLE